MGEICGEPANFQSPRAEKRIWRLSLRFLRFQVLVGAEILFDTGQFALKPAATGALEKVAGILKGCPDLPILIEGHTDSVGQPQANQTLSENRASSVKTWLVSNAAVPAGRIATRGHGQTAPVATNDTAEGRQMNRRVEIKLQKK
jgi:outer membrane protein OmpA-like peptidoglycan-associated protein